MEEIEVWKDVPNYEGLYQVSNFGNVRSFKFDKVKLLKGCVNSIGYCFFVLYKNKKPKTFKVHKLVAFAFLGEANGFDVNHKDGNRKNNVLENLEYVSHRDNIAHGYISKKTSSKYIGVYWYKRNKKYMAQIYINGKRKYLGCFETEEQASNAYQKALTKTEPDAKYAKE